MADQFTPPPRGSQAIPFSFLDAVGRESRATNRKRLHLGGEVDDPLGSNEVLIRNDSGADVDQFGILGITGIVFTPTDNLPAFKSGRVVLTGDAPSAPTSTALNSAGKFVVAREPIADGKIGRAIIYGTSPVQINILAAGDKFADVADGDLTALESGNAGSARILFASGTGLQWCLVLLNATNKGEFPVKVTKDGGSDGTQSTTASWTYTVKDLAGNTIATAVALSHPRPKGKAVFGTTYGTAFYDGATLVLWNAGEVPTTGSCP